MRIRIAWALGLLGSWGLVCGCGHGGGTVDVSRLETDARPNLILIYVDDLGYADISLQGAEFPTPHIDSIARDGIHFTRGYVAHPECGPSRAALLTGLVPARLGYFSNGDRRTPLPLDRPLLAEALRSAGYRTGITRVRYEFGEPKGFDEVLEGYPDGRPAPADRYYTAGRYLTDLQASQAVEFIERNRDRPFFLYFEPLAVHSPLVAPQTYVERVNFIEDEKRRLRAAMTVALDDAVGLILDSLDRMKIAENTLLFFISDNGGPSGLRENSASRNTPFRGGKHWLYEGGVRVPFLVRWPAGLPSGHVYPHAVSTVDIYPTLLAAARATLPHNLLLDGVNLLPFIGGEASIPRKSLFWHFRREAFVPGGIDRKAVLVGDWKLLRSDRLESVELYDLSRDPAEERDLSSSEPEKVQELLTEIDSWLERIEEGR